MKTTLHFKNRIETHRWRTQSICTGLLLVCLLMMARGRAQDYWVVHHFTGLDGSAPTSLLLSNDTLFGTTTRGGSSNCGTVFKVGTDGSDFMVLKEFTGRDGAYPAEGLVLADMTLYGRTAEGGISNCGTVFRVNTDGSDFALVKDFNDSEKANIPHALALAGTTLFGTAYNGGCSNLGSICKLNTDGSGFEVIKDFTDPVQGGGDYTEGCLPGALLAISGTTLYGTTVGGGVCAAGGIFKMNSDGTGYTALKQGSFEDGGHFMRGVIVSGDTLYGVAPWGGGGMGGIFRLNTDGTGYSMLKRFHPFEIQMVSSLAVSGSWLCGVSQQSGFSNNLAVFLLATNGNQFALLKQFNNAEGVPGGLAFSPTILYGVTSSGGRSNHGTVFGLSLLPPAILQPPPSQTAEVGATVTYLTKAEGASPLTYEWFFNRTNILSGYTNASLVLTNVQMALAGDYSVVVTNLFGRVTSPPASLSVIAPVTRTRVPGINVRGETGRVLQVDYANNLSLVPNWLPLETVSLTSTSQFFIDLTAPLPPQRFYRSRQTGTPGPTPTLGLYMIPALTLTGNVGDFVRVDGINAIGPTDAWFTLGAVTLTNTSQLYFDVTAPDQPRRLYRLVRMP